MMSEAKNEASELMPLLCVLSDISTMCVGELTMGYKLDANTIGQMIHDATGLTQPELHELAAAAKEQTKKVEVMKNALSLIATGTAEWDDATPEMERDGMRLIAQIALDT